MPVIQIRSESPSDIEAISQVVEAAFRGHPHSNQTEHLLVDALRKTGDLTLLQGAIVSGQVVGHIAFYPVTIDGVF